MFVVVLDCLVLFSCCMFVCLFVCLFVERLFVFGALRFVVTGCFISEVFRCWGILRLLPCCAQLSLCLAWSLKLEKNCWMKEVDCLRG